MASRSDMISPTAPQSHRIVLITGGAGFIGSHVVEFAIAKEARPIVLDDLSKGSRANLPNGIDLIEADISGPETMKALDADLPRLDAIIHCAAQASVVASTEDPLRDLSVNVGGTVNVLALAARHGCPVVFASTGGAIYGATAPRPTTELAATEPAAPYGASKAAAEIYLRMHSRELRLPHTILRLGNVYGPRQRGDGEAGVVAIFADRLHHGHQATLYGHGQPTRDYVHVADVARAMVSAIGTPGTFNIATGIETSVAEVYALARSAVPDSTSPEPALAPLRPGELEASCLDISTAKAVLRWEPQVIPQIGIPETVTSINRSPG